MMILAIDTSGPTFSAALVREEDAVLGEIYVRSERHHSELLLPGIERLLQTADLQLRDLDILACTVGPGSFTGIRIGVATIKGLALAAGVPVIGVSSLKALAFNTTGFPGLICPMLDARRGQVYTGLYRSDAPGNLAEVLPEGVRTAEEIAGIIAGEAIFIGSGAQVYGDVVRSRTTGTNLFAPPHLHRISAAAVAVLARRQATAGETTDALRLFPVYLRRSEAEENEMENIDR